LRKVVTCWCREHHCFPSKVVFKGLDGNTLDLDSSPQSYGWCPLTGKDLPAATVIANPRPGAEAQWCAVMLGASDTSAEMDSLGLQRVHVVARGDGITSTIRFRIAPDTPLARLMTTWCNLGNISISEVRFTLHGKSLQPTDQLIQLGSAVIGVGSNKAQGYAAGSHVVEICAEPTCSRSTLGRGQQMMAPAELSPRIQVRIQTEDTLADKLGMQNGDSGVTASTTGISYWTKMHAPLCKTMAAWCKPHGLNVDDVVFRFNEQHIQPCDKASDLGWLPNSQIILTASLKNAISSSMPAQRNSASASLSQDNMRQESDSDVITVKVIAQGVDGPSTVNFKMKKDTLFGKMMTAWCTHHSLKADMTSFLLDGKRLQPEDTPASSQSGVFTGQSLVVQAVPSSAKQW